MSVSHFGELWLVGSHGGGITSGASDHQRTARRGNTSGMSYIEIAVRQSELGAVALPKAAWWDLRVASLPQ